MAVAEKSVTADKLVSAKSSQGLLVVGAIATIFVHRGWIGILAVTAAGLGLIGIRAKSDLIESSWIHAGCES